jgi:hypothetical protein
MSVNISSKISESRWYEWEHKHEYDMEVTGWQVIGKVYIFFPINKHVLDEFHQVKWSSADLKFTVVANSIMGSKFGF